MKDLTSAKIYDLAQPYYPACRIIRIIRRFYSG